MLSLEGVTAIGAFAITPDVIPEGSKRRRYARSGLALGAVHSVKGQEVKGDKIRLLIRRRMWNEFWLPVVGFEKRYIVSTQGQVKRLHGIRGSGLLKPTKYRYLRVNIACPRRR